ncbi:hypothetical protein NLI96_g10462 [Meripilus lineatus]|uniref:Uncharacterized protein n=1 Tax=Meripilus lineatus TaxID=2056292 RepID=A0AAD5UTK7_9APHY|nr:hypothetical protein NLI96_g10462 [Physisporinus lineatus]
MKPSVLVLLAVGITATQASWFGSDSGGVTTKQSPSPASQWTQEQFDRAQVAFTNLKSDAFDTWDESRLREFLLEQGIVKPSGTREQLALLAKQKYSQYTDAASVFSKSVTDVAGEAKKTAETVVGYGGDTVKQASRSASSFVAQATQDLGGKIDESKDYVWSTWDDNRLRSYLEEKGVIKTKQQATRDQLLAKMKESYTSATDPKSWLVSHGIIKSDAEKTRDQLVADMGHYYYNTRDTAYTTWSDSQMRQWLIDHNVIKSEAQIQREKLQRLVADNYANAKDTIWAVGEIATCKTRDELVALMSDKYVWVISSFLSRMLTGGLWDRYNDYSSRTAPYLVWPDARLRAYLRENNISEDALPTSRPGLLQEVRIRWVQTSHRADATFARILEVINNSVTAAEEKIGMILDMLTGHMESAKHRGQGAYEQGRDYADEKYYEGKEYATSKAKDAKDKTREYEKAGKKYWNEKAEEAKVEL